jgi:hypothetical protein
MSIRIQHEYLLGRLALAGGRAARDVERHARALAGVDNPVAQVWAHVLRAGAAIRAGDTGRAESLIDDVIRRAGAAGMKLTVAAAEFRLAELRRDDALMTRVSIAMSDLGIRVPIKMTALLFPTGTR